MPWPGGTESGGGDGDVGSAGPEGRGEIDALDSCDHHLSGDSAAP